MSNSTASDLMDTVHNDVVFVVGSEEIPCNRAAFAASCPYFDQLLNGDFCQSDKVEITRTSAKVFKEIKRYIDSGRLETAKWKIDDLLVLLAVADKYQYQQLFTEVVIVLEGQRLDFDTWTLVNSAAGVHASALLKAKCVSFAEGALEGFLCLKYLENYTEEFICFMFDTPKIKTVNQDKLLCGLLQWKKINRSAQIRSLIEKISWNGVSPKIAAIIAKALLLNFNNEDEVPFWNQMVNEIQMQSHCIIRVDNILFKTQPVKRKMKMHEAIMFGYHIEDYIHLNFTKNGSSIEIPVKGIEFELSSEYHIRKVGGQKMTIGYEEMDYKILEQNNNLTKYSATYSDAEDIHYIRIYCDKFAQVSEITFRSVLIYSGMQNYSIYRYRIARH